VESALALVVGGIAAGGIFLLLQRNLLRFVVGLILLSGAVNLLIFTAGRVTRGAPPLVPEGAYAPTGVVANALPQALILTAIVISFGLTAFALVLLLRVFQNLGSLNTDELAKQARALQALEDATLEPPA
jgi:multicomponent Na+:H+ antiporter subunit C